MPEFEENNSQTNSTYSYTPSTSTSKSKGGRRRSGGFKSETIETNSKIGVVDPTEVLKAEKKNPPSSSSEASEKPEKRSKASSAERVPEKTTKAKDSKPQPSQATLDSIRSVEEKIAKRRAENEKNRPTKTGSAAKKSNVRSKKKNTSSSQSGLLAAIGRFFGKLLGSSPKSRPAGDRGGRGQAPQRQRSKSQHQNSRRRPRKDSSGNRRKNSRGAPGNRRNNKSKNNQ